MYCVVVEIMRDTVPVTTILVHPKAREGGVDATAYRVLPLEVLALLIDDFRRLQQ
jgi:hypothetical protein